VNIERKIENCIGSTGPVSPGDQLLLAVSGGADSIAMLHALHALAPRFNLSLTVVHVNHGLRGSQSDGDAEFVVALAKRLKLACRVEKVDARKAAKKGGISIEMASRDLRYKTLSRIARDIRGTTTARVVIVTAHTADDQAETMLLRLARGTGRQGLSGIRRERYIDNVAVVRPLLDTNRSEVIAYLNSNEQSWREDESNRNVEFLRNRVRHEILPALEKLNPKVRDALVRTAGILREEDTWLDSIAQSLLETCRHKTDSRAIDVNVLRKHGVAAARRVLRLWLIEHGLAQGDLVLQRIDEVFALMHASRGTGRVAVTMNRAVEKKYDRLVVISEASKLGCMQPFREKIAVSGETILGEQGLHIVTLAGDTILKPHGQRVGSLPASASVSRTGIGRKCLYVRTWKPGDVIRPIGLSGSQKLQDLFVNAKVPRDQRTGIPLLECGGEIVWIPGHRVSRGWEVKECDKILEIHVERI
jgi:tRNA(Ile)-lysidine synthase